MTPKLECGGSSHAETSLRVLLLPTTNTMDFRSLDPSTDRVWFHREAHRTEPHAHSGPILITFCGVHFHTMN